MNLLDDDFVPRRTIFEPDNFNGRFSWLYDSLVGVQADAQFGKKISATIQAVLQDRAENNLDESIEYAFLNWNPTPHLSLRAGRLPSRVYLLSDYRNVSYAYLWERPPEGFYVPNIVKNYDGAEIAFTTEAASGILRLTLFGDFDKISSSIANETGDMYFDMDSYFGGSLTFENNMWRINAAYAQGILNSSVSPPPLFQNDELLPDLQETFSGLLTELTIDDDKMIYYTLGAAYDRDEWMVQGELGYLESEWSRAPSVRSAYLSIGKRFGTYTPFAMISMIESSSSGPLTFPIPADASSFEGLSTTMEAMLYAFHYDQKTLSLGLRKDIGYNLALKCQWDHTKIDEHGAGLWSAEISQLPNPKKNINTISISINWIFGL